MCAWIQSFRFLCCGIQVLFSGRRSDSARRAMVTEYWQRLHGNCAEVSGIDQQGNSIARYVIGTVDRYIVVTSPLVGVAVTLMYAAGTGAPVERLFTVNKPLAGAMRTSRSLPLSATYALLPSIWASIT